MKRGLSLLNDKLLFRHGDNNGPDITASGLVEIVVRAIAARKVLTLPAAAERRRLGDGVLDLHIQSLVAVKRGDGLQLGRGRAARRGDGPRGGARQRDRCDKSHGEDVCGELAAAEGESLGRADVGCGYLNKKTGGETAVNS